MKIINKKSIIVLIILVLLVVIGDIYLVNNEKTGNKTNNNQNNSLNATLKELAYNNYLLTYLIKGDVQVADGYVVVDDVTYYAVDDEKLKDIKTLDDITALIDKVFEGGLVSLYTNYLSDENYNNYIYINDYLYVKKGTSICHNLAPYDESIIKYEDGNGANGDKLVVMNEVIVRAVNIDNNWYTTALEYHCMD